jgi:cobalt/nickel transport system ATP-binding protein
MIELKDICFGYGSQPVLNYFSMTVNDGETVALCGDNGCGKSTVLGILNGLIFADKGTYIFNGDEITEKKMKSQKFSKSFHQKIGYVFQNTELQLFCSSVYEEIAFGPRQMGMDDDEVDKRVLDMLKFLNIEKLRDRAPYHLSCGEKKKVAIASVLAVNPQVLILDEPLNFLDKASSAWLVDFLISMKKAGKTIILVTHSDQLVTSLNARVINM